MAIITVIGGSNIDIQGFPHDVLRPADSNPGRVTLSEGGVGRNIAESLARLGHQVRLVSAFGGDAFGDILVAGLERWRIDISASLRAKDERSSVYLCILDGRRSLEVAIADMALVDRLAPSWIEAHRTVLDGADLCVVDANLPAATIEFIAENFAAVPSVLDTVSVAKAGRATRYVGAFRAVKPNREEAEVLTGVRIGSDADLVMAADILHGRGTELVFISLGARGLFFSGGTPHGTSRGIVAPVPFTVANTSGAGDALTAAIASGMAQGLSVEAISCGAVAAASLTAAAEETVCRTLDADALERASALVRVEHIQSLEDR